MTGAAPEASPRPSIGVAGDHFPPALIRLLGEVGHWCRVIALTADVAGPVDAVVARRPGLLDAPQVVRARPRATAVWVDQPEDLARPVLASADVVLSDQPTLLETFGSKGLAVPRGGESPAGRWVAPHVRLRLRAARGLPTSLVVEHVDDGWQVWPGGRPLPVTLTDTALASASAAVVTATDLLLSALAWGTPTVTDSETAVAAGAQAGRHVLVDDDAIRRRRRGLEVATDLATAAQLSWWGYRLVETWNSPNRAAAALVRRLGLGSASPLPLPTPLAARLSEFDTPRDAVVVGQAEEACGPYPAAATSGRPATPTRSRG